jgi:maltose alpha-D-glucosyltransferase/alpha-amylase
MADAFLAIAPGLESRASGFDRLIGRAKTRVHGDYHLGQTLRTQGGNFIVLDFEGEPQRSIEERRRKTSPLKDVAGMLRSFSYARGTSTPWLSPGSVVLHADLVNWERGIRDAFLATYISTVADGGGSFLPESAEDMSTALSAWELDKAAYEVLYELNNRPDWLWIPLAAMIKYGAPDSN